MNAEPTPEYRISRSVLAGLLLVATAIGGFAVNASIEFSLEVLWPALTQSGAISSISMGGTNPLVFAVVGGIPALAISYLLNSKPRYLSPSRVLSTVWVGPVVMSFLLLMMMTILWPPTLAMGLVLTGLIGLSCALLFELAALASIVISRVMRSHGEDPVS